MAIMPFKVIQSRHFQYQLKASIWLPVCEYSKIHPDDLFLVIASESDDLFSGRLLTTPIFSRCLSSVLSKFIHKKINFRSGVARWSVSPKAVSLPP